MNDLDAFANLAQALDPWRAHLIFIGGWGHRLHTLHPQANQLEHQPVFTRDTDLAFANRAPFERDIKAALTAHGFTEELGGDFKPPAAHYILGDEQGGFYAEFLTPLGGQQRDQARWDTRCDGDDRRYLCPKDPSLGHLAG